jgi:predicted peptidase
VPDAPLGYSEYLPAGYGYGVARPLIVFNHGSDESGDGSDRDLNHLRTTALPAVIDQGRWPADRPFVVLMPQHDATVASPCTTADEIDAFLKFALSRYDVDPTRVYLTGVSCGAVGEWDYLGQHLGEIVAAAIPIAGDGHAALDAAGCELGRVPIWAIHGDADTIVDPSGSVDPITALQHCTDPAPVDAELTLLPHVGHAFWDVVYDTVLFHFKGGDIYAWLLDHVHAATPPAPSPSS